MLYAILCYDDQAAVGAWEPEEDAAVMARMDAVMAPLAAAGRLGPVARLQPTTSAVTVRTSREQAVLDGPFAETKEQLLGFFVIEADDLDGAVRFARDLAGTKPTPGAYEIRPIGLFNPVAP